MVSSPKVLAKRLGQCAPRKVARTVSPHPSRGGSRGYEYHWRLTQIARYNQGLPVEASKASICRWIQRAQAFESTGNKSNVKMSGEFQTLLIQYREVWPKANADEVRRFIMDTAAHPQHISRQDVYRAQKRLRMTRKRASTTAYQAFSPRNLARRRLFWSHGPPVGIAGVPIAQLIDMDECAFQLSTANRYWGTAYTGVRIRDDGHYPHSQKWTLMLAVDAAGSHYCDAAHHLIYAAGHLIVPRPPYRPEDAPIEYCFNQVETTLKSRFYTIKTEGDLIREVHAAVRAVHGVRETFVHCGY
ncbi:hypothetical protein B484DRAFT_466010 [Ochromonadaceae sp. CCMP2298]|nr:hypothetical protein B484DRAFT_466010 [Ochromonadaceae sp. CCMP2298]